MSKIEHKFAELRNEGRKGFIPFVSVGDPDLQTSFQLVLMLAEKGADIIELGVPFTDPMADGPTIQASSMRALANGITLEQILQMVAELRTKTRVPIVLFSYLNPLYRFGIGRLAKEGAEAGIDGILVTDAVDDEAAEISTTLRASGIDLISLVAPTTSDERLERIAANASGFIYAVSRAGVTGARGDTSDSAEDLVKRVRKYTELPVAVGFGISTRKQIEDVWRYADAAVVGSAIVNEIARSIPEGNTIDAVGSFIDGLLPEIAKRPTGI